MKIILKITNNKKMKGYYNNIAADREGNKYFLKSDMELSKNNYYLVDIVEYKKEINLEGLLIRISSYNSIELLEIINNRLYLNNQVVKSDKIVLNSLELKLLEKYDRIKHVSMCLNGLDSAKQGILYNREMQRLDWEVKRIKAKLS